MNASERYDLYAMVFHRETGMVAPGKDDVTGTHTYEQRRAAWDEWLGRRNTVTLEDDAARLRELEASSFVILQARAEERYYVAKCTTCNDHGCVRCLAAHPVGKTCTDCTHVTRCLTLLGITGNETHCDWIPSRFRAHPCGRCGGTREVHEDHPDDDPYGLPMRCPECRR